MRRVLLLLALLMAAWIQPCPAPSAHASIPVTTPKGLKGYRITISPLTDPPNTYYEAVGGGGFYTGIQICGGTCGDLGSNRQLIFSTWDEGALKASLVSKGNMTFCEGFGGEGTGIHCFMAYPWKVGGFYQFQVMFKYGTTGGHPYTDHQVTMTDLGTGSVIDLGTQRWMSQDNWDSMDAFTEWWAQDATNCSQMQVQQVVLGNPAATWDGTSWRSISSISFSRTENDPACNNWIWGSYCGGQAAPGGASTGLSGWIMGTGGDSPQYQTDPSNPVASNGSIKGCFAPMPPSPLPSPPSPPAPSPQPPRFPVITDCFIDKATFTSDWKAITSKVAWKNQGKKKAKAYYASPFTTVPFFGTVPVLVTNASQEVVGAAARRGQGRVVVLGHEGMIVDVQPKDPFWPALLTGTLSWLAGSGSAKVSIAGCDSRMASVVASYLIPLLPSRLKPYTSSASGKATGSPFVKPSELAKAGTKLGIWVCTLYFNTTGNLNGGSDWPLVDPVVVRNWVGSGGSFFAGGQSWYWESVKTSPNATFPANDLLSYLGITQTQEAVVTGTFVPTVPKYLC